MCCIIIILIIRMSYHIIPERLIFHKFIFYGDADVSSVYIFFSRKVTGVGLCCLEHWSKSVNLTSLLLFILNFP